MSTLYRRDFSAGWNPSADSVNCPLNALLRMDNCILDEEGCIALRQGSDVLNSALATTNVDSLYTVPISGTTYRFAQGTGSVYADPGTGTYSSLASGLDSSLDLNFSSYLGQVFLGSGTFKKKYNGTLRTWGIATPGDTPTTSFAGAGADLTGDYTWVWIYVRSDGTYLAYSGPSHETASASPAAQKVQVAGNNPTDTQVTAIWQFRLGGTLDEYYRTATKTVSAWSSTTTIDDELSDEDALKLDITLESLIGPYAVDGTTTTVPPNNIIGISEDYYTRIFVLTSDGMLYPSRRISPDTFNYSHGIRVFGATEVGYWIKKTFGGLYVGTSKDVYRIDGTGAENPDGTIDFTLTPLNVNSPPVDRMLATDGNVIIYRASDGPRLFTGQNSTPIRGDTDLLWRGYDRHGVESINKTSSSARFRAAIQNGNLFMLVPEGDDTTTSAVYRYNIAKQRWSRHTYPNPFRSIYREPDGTLVAGDASGYVWQLETGTSDNGTGIAVNIRTRIDDNAEPKNVKDGNYLAVRSDTGGIDAGLALYLDGSTSQALNVNPNSDGEGLSQFSLATLDDFRQVQMILTGTFTTFRLYDYALEYTTLPDARTRWETGPINLGTAKLFWVRQLRIRAKAPSALTVTPYFDGVAFTSSTVTGPSGVALFTATLGREAKGSQLSNIVCSCASECIVYSIEVVYRASGGEIQKKTVQVAEQ